jgi:hypothetical protein
MALSESVHRSGPLRRAPLSALAVALTVWLAAPAAGLCAEKNKAVSQQDRARQLREAADVRALRHLGYESLYPPDAPRDRETDYYALGQTMARLAAVMQGMGAAPGWSSSPAPTLGSFMNAAPPPAYGPDGPTEKSVRLILEYRLMLAGNPRLKVGSVTDKGEAVHATVVTVDGSLVEEYDVNKSTGAWAPVRRDK